MAWFACKNGNGGSGSNKVGTITVQAYENTVVTCTKGQTVLTKTADSSEEVVFDIPESGDWVVSAGQKSTTISLIPQDYDYNFKFNPVLYELGTFNETYDNPGEFTMTGYTIYNGGCYPNAKWVQFGSTNARKTAYIFAFSQKIDVTNYSYVRFYTDQNFTQYKSLDLRSLTGEYYIGVVGYWGASGNNRTVAGFATQTKQIGSVQSLVTNSSGVASINVYKIEMVE